MKKGKRLLIVGMIFLISVFLIAFASASPVCCEKTKTGLWCQFTDEANCDSSYNAVPYSCEATSYCKLGTCINSNEGTCLPTAEVVCDNAGGYWDGRARDEIPQCQLGCCILGESVAFITQTRCEKFSSIYGLTTDFRGDIKTELACLSSANPSVKGACTYGEPFARKCELITKKECTDLQANSAFSNVEFHEGYLCSAEVLETTCGKKGGTTCGDNGKVYFLDTCGNLANVYDASLIDNENYWTYIQEPSSSCTIEAAKGSASCGNCDYYAGSTCKPVRSGESVSYGDNICRDLDCKDYRNSGEGFSGSNYPIHGEAWCADSSGTDTIIVERDSEGNIIDTSGSEDHTKYNLPGSQYFVKECWEGEVSVKENCDISAEGGRGKVCVQSEINDIKFATCKVNNWGDCNEQTEKEDCEDREKRDCKWIAAGYYFDTENALRLTKSGKDDPKGVCVPLYAPGFDRDTSVSGNNGQDLCERASTVCVVTYTAGIGDLRELKDITGEDVSMEDKYDFCEKDPGGGENCECLLQSWENKINNICTALGDCGNKNNFIGRSGQNVNPIDVEPIG